MPISTLVPKFHRQIIACLSSPLSSLNKSPLIVSFCSLLKPFQHPCFGSLIKEPFFLLLHLLHPEIACFCCNAAVGSTLLLTRQDKRAVSVVMAVIKGKFVILCLRVTLQGVKFGSGFFEGVQCNFNAKSIKKYVFIKFVKKNSGIYLGTYINKLNISYFKLAAQFPNSPSNYHAWLQVNYCELTETISTALDGGKLQSFEQQKSNNVGFERDFHF